MIRSLVGSRVNKGGVFILWDDIINLQRQI